MTVKQCSLGSKFMLSGLLLAGITSQIVPSLSTDSKIKCYETQRDSSWKYLEYLFVVKPANELKQASSNAQAFMAIAGALFLARTGICNFINPQSKPVVVKAAVEPIKHVTNTEEILLFHTNKEIDKINKETAKGSTREASFDLAGHLAGLVISGVAYQSYCGYIESNIRMNTMIKFLENWSTHRSHVPEEFAAAFDELAASYSANQNSLTNEQLNEMFEIIQHLVEHTFEKRYPKAKDLDILGTFKTFTDIGKNLKG
ncbi:MAG: hypothetical protein WC747_02370 [Candidatus Babeliales bacterium]|jgi:hypothetical protein